MVRFWKKKLPVEWMWTESVKIFFSYAIDVRGEGKMTPSSGGFESGYRRDSPGWEAETVTALGIRDWIPCPTGSMSHLWYTDDVSTFEVQEKSYQGHETCMLWEDCIALKYC